MTNDEKIQFILEHIPMTSSFNGPSFYLQHWGEDESNTLVEIENIMQEHRLIKINKESRNYSLTILGERVLANGGWLKFLDERAKNQQLQREHEAEYESIKSENAKEKERNLANNSSSTASNQPPGANEGMSFKNVLLLIGALALLAVIIWFVWS